MLVYTDITYSILIPLPPALLITPPEVIVLHTDHNVTINFDDI